MKVYADILMITVIVVYLTDYAKWWRFPTAIIRWIAFRKFEGFAIKPLSCSFCMTWWCGLIYLAMIHNITISTMATVCVCSFCTRAVGALMDCLNEGIIKIINRII